MKFMRSGIITWLAAIIFYICHYIIKLILFKYYLVLHVYQFGAKLNPICDNLTLYVIMVNIPHYVVNIPHHRVSAIWCYTNSTKWLQNIQKKIKKLKIGLFSLYFTFFFGVLPKIPKTPFFSPLPIKLSFSFFENVKNMNYALPVTTEVFMLKFKFSKK